MGEVTELVVMSVVGEMVNEVSATGISDSSHDFQGSDKVSDSGASDDTGLL